MYTPCPSLLVNPQTHSQPMWTLMYDLKKIQLTVHIQRLSERKWPCNLVPRDEYIGTPWEERAILLNAHSGALWEWDGEELNMCIHTQVQASKLSALLLCFILCPWMRVISECNVLGQGFWRACLLCMKEKGSVYHHSVACCLPVYHLALIHSFLPHIILTRHCVGYWTQESGQDRLGLCPPG